MECEPLGRRSETGTGDEPFDFLESIFEKT